MILNVLSDERIYAAFTTEAAKRETYSVILLDEIEKARSTTERTDLLTST